GLCVDHQLELSWLFDRKVGRLGALDDLVDVYDGAPIQIGKIHPIEHKASCFRMLAKAIDRGQPAPDRQLGEAGPVSRKQRTVQLKQAAGTARGLECSLEVIRAPNR